MPAIATLPQPNRTREGFHRNSIELSDREKEILELWSRAGLSNTRIAERLQIAPGTVRKHVGNIYNKLGVNCRFEAAEHFARLQNPTN